MEGKEALAMLRKQQFDLVLMDVQMPGMDGFEVTPIIRKGEESSGAHQLIIAMTAHARTGSGALFISRDGRVCFEADTQAGFDEAINRVFPGLPGPEPIHEDAAGDALCIEQALESTS